MEAHTTVLLQQLLTCSQAPGQPGLEAFSFHTAWADREPRHGGMGEREWPTVDLTKNAVTVQVSWVCTAKKGVRTNGQDRPDTQMSLPFHAALDVTPEAMDRETKKQAKKPTSHAKKPPLIEEVPASGQSMV